MNITVLPEETKRQAKSLFDICIVLVLLVFAVFGRTVGFGFVNYDDNKYIYENPVVTKGLTLKGVGWAFSYGEIGHWHPLTWLSHMADCQIYGLHAYGHHLSNVALHALAAILLFLALREMTGAMWRSAFVAAVFAIHPLRAESVAWISERKDVLSGVFFMLTLGAYARYVRQPSVGRYVGVAFFFGLGLLCKNMLVTLPFVLLLLDWWPLHRLEPGRYAKLVKEKIPLLLLSLGSCVATALVPEKIPDTSRIPFHERIGNGLVSYVIYLRQMIYPTKLAIPYPNPPHGSPLWQLLFASVLLAAITLYALAFWKKRPYLLLGWLWYVGMLIPVIGFVQISYYSHEDRYTYLPGIGAVLAVTWLVGDWSASWKHRQVILGGLAIGVIAALMVCAFIQTGYWKSSEALWTHAIACTSGNYIAHNNLGSEFFREDKVPEAINHFKAALEIEPDFAEARNNLGNALDHLGKTDEAIAQYQKALDFFPAFADAQLNLGNALLRKGSVDEAVTHFQEALQINPDFEAARVRLGVALRQSGNPNEAIAQYEKALENNPLDEAALVNLGVVLLQQGRLEEAIVRCQNAIEIRPDDPDAHYNLGTAFLRKGDLDDAIIQFHKALEILPKYTDARINLGNSLLHKGRVDEAIAEFQSVLRVDPDNATAQNGLGTAFQKKGNYGEAILHFKRALQADPAEPGIANNLAWLLAASQDASLRDGNRAVELAMKANAKTGGENPIILHTLAASYAEARRFSDAMDTARHALRLAEAQRNPGLSAQLQLEMKLYEAGRPFHLPSQSH